MAVLKGSVGLSGLAIAFGWLLGSAADAKGADGPVSLVEMSRPGVCTKASIAMVAEGLYRPSAPPASSKEQAKAAAKPKPLALKVETRLEFVERLLKPPGRGDSEVGVRRVLRAAAAINGEVRPSSSVLRPDVALLLAEPKVEGVVVTSFGGPLTRSELELVQGPGDPLALSALMPVRPVAVGDRWKIGESAVKGLTAYDELTSNGLQATLESVDDNQAVVKLKGDVRGHVLGGEGTINCSGSFVFDRKAGRIAKLVLDRREVREAGPVEAGLDMKSRLTVTRETVATPAELADETIGKLSLAPDPNRELLFLTVHGGKASFQHDRQWHTYWDNERLTVLKRLEGTEVVAQCNISVGPNAGKGRHQDLDQFRNDIKKGLADRFTEFLGAGELEADNDPAVGFRYKVGVQGKQGDLGLIWYYYLLAGPEGDQVLGTFTLASSRFQSFGDNDERLMGSIHWTTPAN